MLACCKCFGCWSTEPFQSFDTKISCCGFFLFESKLFYLEILVVEAVEQEVQKIWNNSFGSFTFQKVYQVVVGCRKEFNKNLSYDTDTRFFNVK